jgi:hypothetical protein
MSSLARLDLQLEEPGDNPLSNQVFEIIRGALQPNSKLPLETAIQRIVDILPEGKPYSSEVGTFLETCYEVVDQIPLDLSFKVTEKHSVCSAIRKHCLAYDDHAESAASLHPSFPLSSPL